MMMMMMMMMVKKDEEKEKDLYGEVRPTPFFIYLSFSLSFSKKVSEGKERKGREERGEEVRKNTLKLTSSSLEE